LAGCPYGVVTQLNEFGFLPRWFWLLKWTSLGGDELLLFKGSSAAVVILPRRGPRGGGVVLQPQMMA